MRYHDDVLALYENRACCKAMVNDLKVTAHGRWKVVVEDIASVGACLTFLDLDIEVAVPRVKVMAAQSKPITPLCASSAHVAHVHKSWPRAVATRVLTLSGNNVNSLETLSSRYRGKGVHEYT